MSITTTKTRQLLHSNNKICVVRASPKYRHRYSSLDAMVRHRKFISTAIGLG